MANARPHGSAHPVDAASQAAFACSYGQERIWSLHQLAPDSAVHNVQSIFRLVGALQIQALRLSLTAIVRRHEILRTKFASVEGRPVPVVLPILTFRVRTADLGKVAEGERANQVLRL